MDSSNHSFGDDLRDFLGGGLKGGDGEDLMGQFIKGLDKKPKDPRVAMTAIPGDNPEQAFLMIASVLRQNDVQCADIIDGMLKAMVNIAAISMGVTRENGDALRAKVKPHGDKVYEGAADLLMEFAKIVRPLCVEWQENNPSEESDDDE
jgi:hypothetical protein